MIGISHFKSRLRSFSNLLFFICSLLYSCQKHHSSIHLIWSDQRAVGISIPKDRIKSIDGEISQLLSIRLKSNAPVNMLGDYSDEDSVIVFRPLVPLTRGLTYEVANRNEILTTIQIPALDKSDAPKLIGIFPSSDTLPENLLKIHLKFSKPMVEGRALQYITLFENDRDTVKGAFLNLQPELWNVERDLLTVWLDPGRIKRGLHPNKDLGAPLTNSKHYKLVISPQWRDVNNSQLDQQYEKLFIVSHRDSLSPEPLSWIIHSPKKETMDELCVNFESALDYRLITSALHIANVQGQEIYGQWVVQNNEREGCFKPDSPWVAGNYNLKVESRVEDLAGNRVDRPFEVVVGSQPKTFKTVERNFIVD